MRHHGLVVGEVVRSTGDAVESECVGGLGALVGRTPVAVLAHENSLDLRRHVERVEGEAEVGDVTNDGDRLTVAELVDLLRRNVQVTGTSRLKSVQEELVCHVQDLTSLDRHCHTSLVFYFV